MKLIPLTQGKTTLISDHRYELFSKWKWFYQHTGYAVRNSSSKEGDRHLIYMHHEIIDCPIGFFRDHVNRNRLDNQDQNLRICSLDENNRNRSIRIDNSSGYIGVSWNKKMGRWVAYIRINGERKHLLYWNSAKDAALAYDKAARELFGDFAVLNFQEAV